MEENMSDNDTNKDDCDNTHPNRNSKRMKIQSDSNAGAGPSNSTEQDNAASGSTSNENGSPSSRPRVRSYRVRNYRNRNREESEASANESGEGDTASGEENNAESVLSYVDYSSSPESSSTVIRETDTDSETEDFPVLKKTKPKHTWYVVPEVLKRQLGYSAKLQSAELFRNRCYGSLHTVQRLELMYKLKEHYGCVNSLNFYPDGSLLASGSDDLCVVIWDWKIGKYLLKYKSKHSSNVFQTKFLHLRGDLHLATCSRDGQVRVARLSEGGVRENRKIGSHKAACHKLAVLPDQPHIILSAGEDGAVLSHDVRKTKSDFVTMVKTNGKTLPLYSIHGHPLRTNEFCVAGQDIRVLVYDQRKASSPLYTYNPFKSTEEDPRHSNLHVTSAIYNYNGDEILASYNDGDIYLFNSQSIPGEYVHKYEGHKNGATIKGVNFFGPKSEFVVSGSDCGNIFFWERNTEAVVQCMLGDDSGVVNCLEPHPKLPFICTSGLDWDIKVWVPSCETVPSLGKLPALVKANRTNRLTSLGLASDAPVLWMLWQHLRRSSRTLRRELRGMNFEDDDEIGMTSSSDNDEDMNESNEENEDVEESYEVDNNDDEDDDGSIDFTSECRTS